MQREKGICIVLLSSAKYALMRDGERCFLGRFFLSFFAIYFHLSLREVLIMHVPGFTCDCAQICHTLKYLPLSFLHIKPIMQHSLQTRGVGKQEWHYHNLSGESGEKERKEEKHH